MAYTVNLTHRGPQVIECIDLFDEARYGADKLFFRGRFKTADEVKSQVAISLGDTSLLDAAKIKEIYGIDLSSETTTEEDKESLKLKLGIGNPLTKAPEDGDFEKAKFPTIALNRYHIPDKKFWNNVIPTEVKNPYKASSIVRYTIRLHFRDDYAYINFGCPWEFSKEYYEYFGGFIDDTSSSEVIMNNLVFFNCHFISEEDALIVLEKMFPNVRINNIKLIELKKEIKETPEEDIEVIDLLDENGVVFST